MFKFTALTLGERLELRRMTDTCEKFVTKLRKLQPTYIEETMPAAIEEALYGMNRIIENGGFYYRGQYAACFEIIHAIVYQIVEPYEDGTFSIYMHSNGSFRRNWRERAVDGVIPLSARTDVAAVYARLNPDPQFGHITPDTTIKS